MYASYDERTYYMSVMPTKKIIEDSFIHTSHLDVCFFVFFALLVH